MALSRRPLVAHVVYRFDVGGLENGVVNLVNRMFDWRHAVIALTQVAPGFRARVLNPLVQFAELNKPPGHGYRVYSALARELERLAPHVVHTRNLAALEMQLPAWWAGVPVRIHSEHGRDVNDPDGTVRRYQWLRRAHRPFVQHWVALSGDLASYLQQQVGVPASRIARICNGVDTQRFQPAPQRRPIDGCPFVEPRLVVFGTVGRMQTIKAQPLLVEAFVSALRKRPELVGTLRLVLVGAGDLRARCEQILREAGRAELAWLPGERSDVPAIMQGLDVFVLPSLAEGISNTVLEAMASGLPVIATRVGGNAELVEHGVTGEIIAAGDVPALTDALLRWAEDAVRRRAAGTAARERALAHFSLQAMVHAYQSLYERELVRAGLGA
jgi:sugar transferase (PEP-CTERM/EpsH1 system associated)